MTADELRIVIRAETAKAVREMRKAQKATNDTERGFKSMAQSITKSMGAWAVAAVSVRAVTREIQRSVRAFQEQENAERSLTAAITATGREAEISSQAIKDLASELQLVTTFGDEATISAAALLQTLANLSQDQLTQVIPQVQNFAAALGMDLNTAARLVGQTIGGTTNTLSRYGVQIDNTLTGSQRFAHVTDQLSQKFDGFAEALADTSTGSMVRFQNAVGDMRERMGEFVSRSLDPAVRALTSFFEAVNEGANQGRQGSIVDAITGPGGPAQLRRVTEELERQREILRAEGETSRSPYAAMAREAIATLETEREILQNAIDRQGVMDRLNQQAQRAREQANTEEARVADINREYLSQVNQIANRYDDAAAAMRVMVNEGAIPAEESTRALEREARAAALAIASIKFSPELTSETRGAGTALLRQMVGMIPAAEDASEMAARASVNMWQKTWRDQFRAERLQIMWDEDEANRLEQKARDVAQAWQSGFQSIGGMALQTFGMLNQLMSAQTQRQIAEIDKQLRAITNRYESEIAWAKALGATEEELDILRAQQIDREQAAEEDAAKKKKALAADQFRRDQWMQRAQVTMSTATAVMQAYAQLGPIGGHIAAGMIGSMGLAQLGIIQAQQPPAFERGGSFVTNGPQMIQVGDGQSPRERVTVEPLSGPYSKGSSEGITIIINGAIGGREEVARWVNEGIRQGRARGALRE